MTVTINTSTSTVKFAVVILTLFTVATLGSIPAVEGMRKLQQASKDHELVHVKKVWWCTLHSASFPALLVALTFFTDLPWTCQVGAFAASILIVPVELFFPTSGLPSKIISAVSGTLIATFAVIAMSLILQISVIPHSIFTEWIQEHLATTSDNYLSVANYLHFLALLSFAMAAWGNCGLASYGAWAAHPEYAANHGDVARSLLHTIQFHFLLGFVFECLAWALSHTTTTMAMATPMIVMGNLTTAA